jgi:hypothetical protein
MLDSLLLNQLLLPLQQLQDMDAHGLMAKNWSQIMSSAHQWIWP